MATPAQTSKSEEPLRSTYICSGVTVQGLPTRSVLKSEARYFVSISIDGEEEWKSREIRSKESTVGWDKEEDKHEFECAPTASLKATVFKNHSRGRPVEEVGAVTLPLSTWLQTAIVPHLITKLTTKDNPILVRLSLSQKDSSPPAPETNLQDHVPTTGADANTATLQPEITVDMPTAAAADVSDFTHSLADIEKMLEELRGKLDRFTTSMNEMPDVRAPISPTSP
ncbi:hypothetical protein CALVIDRAFT_432336 [Calocera viscosa TUFC12733]|uniref:C2 NT-type domain-containing protein n=1 Tax=Calocera viscosa (strain TUFC12733) TaxID=1330018 RepID=A0A167FXM2_CALVF|nr:hypothetical protein CALVIDRAFT_432336 [Calocera viscosa TUFC12733]